MRSIYYHNVSDINILIYREKCERNNCGATLGCLRATLLRSKPTNDAVPKSNQSRIGSEPISAKILWLTAICLNLSSVFKLLLLLDNIIIWELMVNI